MRKEPTFGPARKAGDEAVDEVIDDRVDEEFLHEIPDHGEEIVVKRGRFGPTIERAKTAFTWVKKYERTLSAFGMVAGFITDNLMFRRIDLPDRPPAYPGERRTRASIAPPAGSTRAARRAQNSTPRSIAASRSNSRSASARSLPAGTKASPP